MKKFLGIARVVGDEFFRVPYAVLSGSDPVGTCFVLVWIVTAAGLSCIRPESLVWAMVSVGLAWLALWSLMWVGLVAFAVYALSKSADTEGMTGEDA